MRLLRSDEERFTPLVKTSRIVDAGAIRQGDPEIMTRLTIGAVVMSVYQAFVLGRRRWEKFRDACVDMLVAYFTPPAA